MTPNRRDILALLGTSAAGLAATLQSVRAQAQGANGVLDVAVIGAGAAGLTAGWLLDQAGATFHVFEAASIHGGRAKKHEGFADFPLDLGGEWIHTTNRVLNQLSGTGGAAKRAIEYRPLTSDVWDGARLRRRNLYARGWRGEHRFISTTWFDFFNDYMAKGIIDRISFNTQVRAIDHSGDLIEIDLATGQRVRAHHVIVTVPLNVLKDGDIQFRPQLPRAKRRALQGVIMPDGFKLFLRFSERFYPDLVLFDHDYDTAESELIFYDVALDKPTQHNVLGFFGHGALATPYVEMSEQAHVRAALSLLDKIYDGRASPAYQDHVLQNWTKSRFHRGTYSYFFDADPATLGTSIDNRVHFAGEAYNQRWDGEWGYMHVAARSAYDAVEEIGL